MQEVAALLLAIGLASPIRVAAAGGLTESGTDRTYTYLGLFQITEYDMCVADAPHAAQF